MHLPNIPAFDHEAALKAKKRQRELTKPPGSLGALEKLSIQLAGITASERLNFQHKVVIVMAADHGIAAEGVSAYPAEATAQMAENIIHKGAAVCVLARQAGARVLLVDMGIAQDMSHLPGLVQKKVAYGSQNMVNGPAMTRAQAEQAIQTGMQVVHDQAAEGIDIVALGEMGIGNTTPAAAITAVITRLPVEAVTGRGTGLDEIGWAHKKKIIAKAIQVNQPDPNDALDVLIKVGGLDIAGLVGVILGAASARLPVVVDGFISASAALIAAGLAPEVKPYLIASHRSVEIGHPAICRYLGLEPLLDLGLRLGEGSGAVVAFHLVEAASRILNEMATFEEAGVSRND